MTRTDWKDARDFVSKNLLVAGLILSLWIHFFLFGGWWIAERLGWWKRSSASLHRPAARQHARLEPARRPAPPKPPQEPPRPRDIPLTFVDVDPLTPEVAPPREAKFYGAKNSQAANPDARIETEIPKSDGKQNQVIRTETAKPDKFPLQPAPPPPKPVEQAQIKPADEEQKPKPKIEKQEKPGDLALARPTEAKFLDRRPLSEGKPDATVGEAEVEARPRPRTVAEAKRQKNMLAGEQVKQDGGVRARGQLSLDVKATAFGEYDRLFIEAVQNNWDRVIEEHQALAHLNFEPGKVVLQFRLTYDGRITNVREISREVKELQGIMCRRAIEEPAPYGKWPADMRRMIGENFRDVTFTFIYN